MTPMLKEIHWLPVRHCKVYKILSLIYKAIYGAGPATYATYLIIAPLKGH